MDKNYGASNIVQDMPPTSHRLALIVWGIAWLPLLLSLIITPGFVTPFFNHPTGRIILLVAAVWQVLCCAILARTTARNGLSFFQIALSAIAILPVALAPMIGPAIVTICGALAPLWGKS